jgi:hypothetical protein
LSAGGDETLHLINIGGGPSSDSLNALLTLNKENGAILKGRRIYIHALDFDCEGPNFGLRSLAAMQADGAPLNGLNITFEYIKYDWNDTSELRRLLEFISKENSIIHGSTEGALLEYGSDKAILANLIILHDLTPGNFAMIGSVLRDEKTADPSLPLLKENSNMTFRLLGLEAFKAIADKAGWIVDKSIEGNPFYHIIRLKKL